MSGIPEQKQESDISELKVAAEQDNNPEAQNKLGLMYRDNPNFATDLSIEGREKEAISCFEKAAAQGLVDAKNNLGLIYYNKLLRGGQLSAYSYPRSDEKTKQGVEKAKQYFEEAAAQNHRGALYNLARLYDKYPFIWPDLSAKGCHDKAVEYYTKAHNQGQKDAKQALERLDPKEAANQYELGFRYLDENYGEYQWKDDRLNKALRYYNNKKSTRELAFMWLSKAAEQGHADAQYQLGRMYYNNHITWLNLSAEEREDQAMAWYEKAAAQDHQKARWGRQDILIGRAIEKNAISFICFLSLLLIGSLVGIVLLFFLPMSETLILTLGIIFSITAAGSIAGLIAFLPKPSESVEQKREIESSRIITPAPSALLLSPVALVQREQPEEWQELAAESIWEAYFRGSGDNQEISLNGLPDPEEPCLV